MKPTLEEIQKTQGTRNSETPPWMSYAAQMATPKMSKELEKEVEKYAETRKIEGSNQSKEELHRQKELSDQSVKEYQFLHPSEYVDEEARKGTIMHSTTFINKLRNECKLNCWYRTHPQQGKVTLVVKREGGDPEVGCWVQSGWTSEYTMMRFDDHGIPVSEKYRGWRTCTLQLILKGILTEEQVNKVFGPAIGPASKRYNSMLYEWRNRRLVAT